MSNPDRRLRAYVRASVMRRKALTAANAYFDGFWLGMLDRAHLAHLDERFYGQGLDVESGRVFGYRDVSHNLAGLRDWERAAVDAHFPPGGRVVVTGAGGGREVIALLERGFDAVGYEPNLQLVEAGSGLLAAAGHRDRLRGCERDTFPPTDERFDAVVVGWGSFMLIPGRARRVAFLRGARRVVPEGAPLLCSFFLRDGASAYHRRLARSANVVRGMRRQEGVDVGDSIGENFVHSFTRGEVHQELADGGFRMVAFEASPYGHAVAIAAPPGDVRAARPGAGSRRSPSRRPCA